MLRWRIVEVFLKFKKNASWLNRNLGFVFVKTGHKPLRLFLCILCRCNTDFNFDLISRLVIKCTTKPNMLQKVHNKEITTILFLDEEKTVVQFALLIANNDTAKQFM